jgi:hypothetical protein
MTHRDPARKKPQPEMKGSGRGESDPNALWTLPKGGWGGKGLHSPLPAATPPNAASDDETKAPFPDRCFTRKSLCEWLSISLRTFDRLAAQGLLPQACFYVSGRARWRPSVVEKWLRTRPKLSGRGRKEGRH